MADYKKNPYNGERNGDGHDYPEAHPNRLVHFIVMHKNKGTQAKTNNYEDQTPNIFPFPCNYQKNK